ncbi:hypothetical protein Cgig2_027683 [Carnegiea gigantea]|uniref:Uncharacterized protein n=1 Tax=Carnegiea gigantea TaxID=171969 RepID=A0A9Q1GWS6_9CARY|nr:hypothetical protein Cgig2_027683 [Carnegiea gigantea]
MTQGIFYAMVLNDAVELGVTSEVAAGAMALVLKRAFTRLDLQDGPSTRFSNPKVMVSLKRPTLEDNYLLPAGYRFVPSEVDTTVSKPPAKCIVIYRVALTYGLRFPLHPVIMDILNKYELALAQIVPTSWHNICSFIATYELHRLCCIGCAFAQIRSVQRALSKTGDLGWYCFNNKRKFVHNPCGEMIDAEKRTARYFHFYVREDDHPRPILSFTAWVMDAQAWVKLLPLESGDAMAEQVAAEAEQLHDEEQRRCTEMQAKKDAVVASIPAPLRVEDPPSKSKTAKGTNRHPQSVYYPAPDEGQGSPTIGESRGEQGLTTVDKEQVPITEALVRALKLARSRLLVSTLEGRICDIESSDALLQGQISNLQAECKRSDEVAAKYRCHLEKLKREKGALEDKKKNLQHQLEEARSKAEEEAKRSAKAEDRGYHRGCDKSIEFFWELLHLKPSILKAILRRTSSSSRIADASSSKAKTPSLGDKETTLLDGEAAIPDEEGDATEAAEGSDRDEEPYGSLLGRSIYQGPNANKVAVTSHSLISLYHAHAPIISLKPKLSSKEDGLSSWGYLLAPKAQDGVHQRDNLPPRVGQLLQAVPGDDVYRNPHVYKYSPHNGTGHLHFYYQRGFSTVVIRGGLFSMG